MLIISRKVFKHHKQFKNLKSLTPNTQRECVGTSLEVLRRPLSQIQEDLLTKTSISSVLAPITCHVSIYLLL